jgi:hypothetical protein
MGVLVYTCFCSLILSLSRPFCAHSIGVWWLLVYCRVRLASPVELGELYSINKSVLQTKFHSERSPESVIVTRLDPNPANVCSEECVICL